MKYLLAYFNVSSEPHFHVGMLFLSGRARRQGSVDDGTTVCVKPNSSVYFLPNRSCWLDLDDSPHIKQPLTEFDGGCII